MDVNDRLVDSCDHNMFVYHVTKVKHLLNNLSSMIKGTVSYFYDDKNDIFLITKEGNDNE